MAMSSVDLSVLTFALSSWLDGSAQLRRSLIFLPLGIGGHHEAVSASNSARRGHAGVNGATGRDNRTFSRGRLVDWFASWLQRPERDLDETEKSLMGVLDVSVSSHEVPNISLVLKLHSLPSYYFDFLGQAQCSLSSSTL